MPCVPTEVVGCGHVEKRKKLRFHFNEMNDEAVLCPVTPAAYSAYFLLSHSHSLFRECSSAG